MPSASNRARSWAEGGVATSANQFFDVSSASQLQTVFQKIADEIASIRLTQ